MIVYLGSNKLKEAYIWSQKIKEIRVGDKRVYPEGYVPNANTLFYITNNWEITDHSSYNHSMSWYWTAKYSTLASWQKVLDLDWTNAVKSSQFTEANNKTNFTQHCRVKLKSWTQEEHLIGRCWRSKSDSGSSDRWGARFQRDSWKSTFYILIWPNSSNWVNTEGLWLYTTPGTSDFVLLTFTISWGTYKIYKNAVLVWTASSSSIRWWSSTWPVYYEWAAFFSDWSLWSNYLAKCYMWETILEDKVETQAEITEYFNLTKALYWVS